MINGSTVSNIIQAMEKKKSAKLHLFLAPFIGVSKDAIFCSNFKGIYFRIGLLPEEEGRIFLVYDTHNFDNEVLNGRSAAKISVMEPKRGHNFTIYGIDIPKDVYRKVADASYSKISEDDKEKILAFWGVKGKEDMLYYILNPLSHFKSIGYEPKRTDIQIWPSADEDERRFKL